MSKLRIVLFAKFSMLLLLIVGLTTTVNAESTYTIAKILAHSDDFDTLVTALDTAGFTHALAKRHAGPYTVFAPTDDAFAALPDGTLEALLADPDGLLADILRYHVASGVVTAEHLAALDSLTTYFGEDVTIEFIPGSVVGTITVPDMIVLNGTVQIIITDMYASNGIIHVIDAVLIPPSFEPAPALPTIAEIAVAEGFDTLVAALDAAGLVPTFADPHAGPFTVFAPTDDAFAALPDGTLDALLTDPDGLLTDILTYHVVDGVVTAEQLATLDSLTTLFGEDVTIEFIPGSVSGTITIPDMIILNETVNIILTDIEASNGIIHVIDAVLIPPEQPQGQETVYVSSSSSGTIDGEHYRDEDILVRDENGNWTRYFDGSDVGLSGSDRDIDAFHILDDGSILLSITGHAHIPDIGYVDDSDIIRFIPTSLGAKTRGSFELYFDGSDVGLSNYYEDIDALFITDSGDIVVSVLGCAHVDGIYANDEDLLIFTPTSLGHQTRGSWALYFDGSTADLGGHTEDIWGATASNSDLYLTTKSHYDIGGLTGDGADILNCSLSGTCELTAYVDGSEVGLDGEYLDGIHIFAPGTVAPAPAPSGQSRSANVDDVEDAEPTVDTLQDIHNDDVDEDGEPVGYGEPTAVSLQSATTHTAFSLLIVASVVALLTASGTLLFKRP